MKFFYSAGTMGYGNGYWWHKHYKFPCYEVVTNTITLNEKAGFPFAILKWGSSVFNKKGLHNKGFYKWVNDYNCRKDVVVSLAGTDEELHHMTWQCCHQLKHDGIKGLEFNFSCPNVSSFNNIEIPIRSMGTNKTKIYLKLNYKQDPYEYIGIDKVDGIRLNSISLPFCGGSGKIAQEKNWEFIKRYNREGLNVAGCSFTSFDDIKRLEDMGCTEVGIGSIILTNPKLVERINEYGRT